MELFHWITLGIAVVSVCSTGYFASKTRWDRAQDLRCKAIHGETLTPIYIKLNDISVKLASIEASEIHNGGFARLTQMVSDLHDGRRNR